VSLGGRRGRILPTAAQSMFIEQADDSQKITCYPNASSIIKLFQHSNKRRETSSFISSLYFNQCCVYTHASSDTNRSTKMSEQVKVRLRIQEE